MSGVAVKHVQKNGPTIVEADDKHDEQCGFRKKKVANGTPLPFFP